VNINKHFKSKMQLFNGAMLGVDTLLLNAVLIQDLLTVKEYAAGMIILRLVQTLGNFYLRSITTEALDDK